MKSDRNAQISILAVVLIALLLGILGSADGVTAGGIPVFRIAVALAFLVNWLAFIPAWARRTESFFDITGSITYLSVMGVAVWLSRPLTPRSILLLALVAAWALRLGSFLFLRIRKAGKDVRFDELKQSFWGFLNVWTIQGLWVSLTLAAALGAVTSTHRPTAPFDAFMVAGTLVWLAGFTIEAVADAQKSAFRRDPANRGSFIHTGLWSLSRHPNYFGEIVLWTGIAIISLPALHGWTYLTLVSPIFVFVLLTRVSGIPLLEKKADLTWGGQPAYGAYKAKTSVLVPLPPRSPRPNPGAERTP